MTARSISKVNLKDKFSLFDEQWIPKVVGELNGQYVKLARLEGEFIWHSHSREDELFLVVEGTLTMALRDRTLRLGPGEMVIIPRNVEHKPVAEEEVLVLMFEPKTTLNTGDVRNEKTVQTPQWI